MERTELQARLEAEVMEVEWDALVPHHARGALVHVAPELPLVKVAMAVSLDFADAAAPWPDWATGSTTVPAESPTSLPGTETTTSLPAEAPLGATTVAPGVSTPTTTVPSVTSTLPSVTSVPTIPGVDPQPVP